MSKDYRDILLPKKSGGFRRVTIPSKELLKYQRFLLKPFNRYLNAVLKNEELSDVMHGFRKGKNCVTAAKRHVGFDCTVILDIKEFFDNCTKEKLPLFHRDFPRCFHHNGYLAQGFATSPVLANIALIPVLKELDTQLKIVLKDYAMTVYADDIQISFNKDKGTSTKDCIKDYSKENLCVSLVQACVEKYGFDINLKKTRIRYSEHGFRRILGINVKDTLEPSRKTKRKLRAAKHQGNFHSVGGLTSYMKLVEPNKKPSSDRSTKISRNQETLVKKKKESYDNIYNSIQGY